MTKPKLLFLLRQKQGQSLWANSTSKKPGLSNSVETLVKALEDAGLDVHLHDVPDYNFIHTALCEIKPDILVMEAYWVKPGKIELLKTLHPNVKWIVRNHSEVPFLAEEGMAGIWNCEYLKMNVEISNVSERTVDDLSPLVDNLRVSPTLLSHLPNVYCSHYVERSPVKSVPKDDIHVGCFGAVRSMKNHVEQAMAAIAYANKTGRKLFFHINGTRVEGNGSQPLKYLQGMFMRLNNCELVEHPWMDKEQFYRLLRTQIDVLLQCSLTESFNIVAADAVICSVPVIASDEVRWLGKHYHACPTSAFDICNHLTNLFAGGDDYLKACVSDQLNDLDRYNERSLKVWINRFG
jgi:hypothetical protein